MCPRAQAQREEEKPLLSTARESPRAAMNTQCSQKINGKFFKDSPFKTEKKIPQGTVWDVYLPSLPSGARGPGLPTPEVLAAGGSFQTSWHMEGPPVVAAWTPGTLGRKKTLVRHSANTYQLARGRPSPCRFIPGSETRNQGLWRDGHFTAEEEKVQDEPGAFYGIVKEGGGLPRGSAVTNPPAVQETWVRSLGQEDPLEKGIATHSSILV